MVASLAITDPGAALLLAGQPTGRDGRLRRQRAELRRRRLATQRRIRLLRLLA